MQLKSLLDPTAIREITPDEINEASLAIQTYPGGYFGRGITVCVGGLTYFTNAWVLVRMLRYVGCKLPIQFWYYGEEECDGWMRELVKPYGVECVDARRKAEEAGCRISQGWPLKPFSILHSPFEEVLALDADNMPVRNPEYLFEVDAYQDTGAIFWPDIARTRPNHAVWDLTGVPFRNEPEFESGQILVNKALAWEPLNLAMWMNEEGRADFIYKIIYGDKDTFRFAWHKFGFAFAMPETPPQVLSVVGGPCCLGVMCQHDLDGERIFQHRNLLKWQLFGENPWVPGFLFEGECREFLVELKRSWSGRIGEPLQSKFEGNTERIRSLVDTIWLMEVPPSSNLIGVPDGQTSNLPVGSGSPSVPGSAGPNATSAATDPWPKAKRREWREIRFMKEGHFGRWSDPVFTFWKIHEHQDETTLTFTGANGAGTLNAKLKLQEDGTWRGERIGPLKSSELHLRPVEHIYPGLSIAKETDGSNTPLPFNIKRTSRRLHVFNSAYGIGDHVTALYACVGAANAGLDIVFHTRFPEWLERVQHPGLIITGDLPPLTDDEEPLERHRETSVIDVNHDLPSQLRFARDKARWYSHAIHPNLKPGRPAKVDREVRIPRFDFKRYALLVPFAAWSHREWPGFNWARLTYLIRESGYEVVVDGTEKNAERFKQVFNSTTALWSIGHPPEWLADAMLGAAAVVCNDSGAAHIAGLLGVPTIAIHAHLPPEFLFAHAKVTSVTPKTNCTFCRWQPDRGYVSSCDTGCSALASIGPEEVLKAFESVATKAPLEGCQI